METENLHQNSQFLRWCERLNLQLEPSPGIQQQMINLLIKRMYQYKDLFGNISCSY